MWRSAFIAFYRSFSRHPLYALLNLLGLSLGIAVFITLSLFVRTETSYENWLPRSDQVYVVESHWLMPGTVNTDWPYAMPGLLDDINLDFPQVTGTRLWDREVTVHSGAQNLRAQEELVDAAFFKVFDLPLITGDKASALSAPDAVMLTEAVARNYFPDKSSMDQIIGQTLRLTDLEGTNTYRVTAILRDPPATTDLRFDIVRLITPRTQNAYENWNNWASREASIYLHFARPSDAAQLNANFDRFTDARAGNFFGSLAAHKTLRLRLVPLRSLHLRNIKTRTSVLSLGLVGVLALLIAAINYINLATARAAMRVREVAVRKTLGATQIRLKSQFLAESLFMSFLAGVLALSLVEVSLPLINSLGGLTLELSAVHDLPTLAILSGVLLTTGLLAGFYPAVVLSAFKPAAVLSSSRTPAGGRFGGALREVLVVLQFGVVIAFFILVTGILTQIQYICAHDICFQRDGLLIVNSTYDPALSQSQREAFWTALRAQPNITSVTASDGAPGDESMENITNAGPEGLQGQKVAIGVSFTGADYFKTYGARLLAGRFQSEAYGGDTFMGQDAQGHVIEGPYGVVLNEKAVSYLGFGSPRQAIGKAFVFGNGLRHVQVVGVVEDMRFRSPKVPVQPQLYLFQPHPSFHMLTAVRYSGVTEPAMRARMTRVWQGIAPEVPFDVVSAIGSLGRYDKPDRDRSNLFSIGAVVAALIGCIGLYGMAAFNTSRRSLEIGLRKVLGASRGQVVRLLVWQFLRPVMLANLIAWPLAWWTLKRWLSQFNDPIHLIPVYFLVPTVVALLIAILTVTGLAFVTAGAEPGKALRHD
jgi:putative ABC transport system permease protein